MTTHTTPADTIPAIVSTLRNHFNHRITRPPVFRQRQLSGLLQFIEENEPAIMAALKADLGKPAAESLAMEISLLSSEIKLTQKKLSAWMKPKKVSTPLMVQPGRSHIIAEPLGVVLIIAPWNYPLQLTLAPLIGALSAGNCAVIKPSELAPATSELLAKKLPNYVDPECLTIVEGGVTETSALLNEKFDYIFYTGSSHVGRIVMSAAAKHLTPVTLELGGKSPCIIDASANLSVAARRIAWGKFSNAGQTCVAPDYVLIEKSVEAAFIAEIKKAIYEFYGDQPKNSPDYGRVINTHHHQRLMQLIKGSGNIAVGGDNDEASRYLAPTVLHNLPDNAPIMADEIFGPILPIIPINNIDEAISFIHKKAKPLALYIFSSDKQAQNKIINQTSSGSVSINYPMLQLAVPDLPFGGVGDSGMGSYHGKKSFDTFSHQKSVLTKPTWPDPSLLYPPYQSLFMRLIRWLM